MMKTLELSTVDQMNCFPDMQSVKYNVLDKVEQITQGRYRVNFEYGYDNQRMSMTKVDNIANATYTKDYVGNCEFIDNNGNNEVRTYLAGPAGVFAVVVQKGNTTNIDYVYKDNLGSWTALSGSTGTLKGRMSYDAWGNLRNPMTWSGSPGRPPLFDRGFTGHEYLWDFGLINMNGRMYDPKTCSFLSPDNNVQDPTSQQGFNRYAYCAYNPLKYVDPSGYRYYGYDEGACYRMIDEMTRTIQREWHLVYESAMESAQLTISMACCLYGYGQDTYGNGSGNHGSPGGGSQQTPIGNNQEDGDPTLITNRPKGIPGSSVTNPASADHLVDQLDAWYTVGDNKPFYLNALTIDLSFLSKKDLTYVNEKTYKINLFTYPYMFLAPDLAMSLGEITLIDVGYNMYKIDDDTYDFNVNNGEYFSNWRNFATSCAGILHGGINEPTFLLHPATYYGGPFKIIFLNNVYIPDNP